MSRNSICYKGLLKMLQMSRLYINIFPDSCQATLTFTLFSLMDVSHHADSGI